MTRATDSMYIEFVTGAAAIAALPPVAGTEPLDIGRVALTAPDAHLLVRTSDATTPLARASVWWSACPLLDGEPAGRIGHYAAVDDAAAGLLLDEARAVLHRQGLRTVVGPMDGSTWFSYRFVTDTRGDLPVAHPPVLLEPVGPPSWPDQWRATGFTPLAGYTSMWVDDLSSVDPRLDAVRSRGAAEGLLIRSFDPDDFDGELDRIHEVAREAFRSAFLYTPIDRDGYRALYAGARDLIVPELVLVAERHGQPVGFGFSLPDHLERPRGAAPRTVIVKTVAVLPGRLTAGLGAWLVEETHQRARRLGFHRAVHALMHESNASLAISRRQGRVMRRYTLFQSSTSAGAGDRADDRVGGRTEARSGDRAADR